MAERLEQIYSELPAIACRRLCQSFCGPITGGATERKRLGAAKPAAVPSDDPEACSFLDGITGGCTVYAIRPMICRLWGVVEDMRCPHGCEPERVLTREEAFAFLQRASDAAADAGSPML